jgi:chromosome segregation ATPase
VSNQNTRLWLKEDTTELLQRELDEAQRMIRTLMRRLADEQQQQQQTQRAYEQMKQNIIEINREHVQIERERDMWRMRAERQGVITYDTFPLLKTDEVNAIRRAMARLHHPDHGGDTERMKQWNKFLDQIEKL